MTDVVGPKDVTVRLQRQITTRGLLEELFKIFGPAISPCALFSLPLSASHAPTAAIGERFPTRDHIRPRSKGFTLDANRAIVCQPCNEDKGSRSLQSFLFRLQRAGDPRTAHVAALVNLAVHANPGIINSGMVRRCSPDQP